MLLRVDKLMRKCIQTEQALQNSHNSLTHESINFINRFTSDICQNVGQLSQKALDKIWYVLIHFDSFHRISN
jgi:hypothetical protein